MKIYTVLLLVVFGSLVMSSNAFAQKDLQNALAKAQFMLRQVNAEKLQIQQERDAIKKEFEEYKKKMEKDLAVSKKNSEKLKGSLGSWKESHQKIKQDLQETTLTLLNEKEAHAKTGDELVKMTKDHQFCHNNNYELADVNNELLEMYRKKNKKGLDPVLGLGRVRLENLIQEYSHRIEDHDLRVLLGTSDLRAAE